MNIPLATYRVQFNSDFDFDALRNLLPYLSRLGISHIYASPIFQAKRGSTHGYDIIDPNKINNELGGQDGFDKLIKEVSANGLYWLQDIVPNHQSYSPENKMIYDLFENGSKSKYCNHYDVDWSHPSKRLKNRILAPFLTEPYSKSLVKKRLSLIVEQELKIKYNDMTFPINKIVTTEAQSAIGNLNSDPLLLDRLLSKQYYALEYWKIALRQINYRRFFDIIDLIGVKTENQAVFGDIHRLTFRLVLEKVFSGLRVDHIDGLYDPEEYLFRLRKNFPDIYLLVEKILVGNERLPDSWPVQGTTGYDYLNAINNLFIQCDNKEVIDEIYREFSGNTQSFFDLLYDCKKIVIDAHFFGDVMNIARLLNDTLIEIGHAKMPLQDMREAVVELFACFPIYRGYISAKKPLFEPFKQAINQAKEKSSKLYDSLNSINAILEKSQASPTALHAIMRLQQFTGAVMAKGLEDTMFYQYARFISVNDVGGNPANFGYSKEEFVNFILDRQRNWVYSLNSTSTHDAKRGEDVRARLNVISEIPNDYKKHLTILTVLNGEGKESINGKLAPSRNEEYYLYQTLLGAYPWNEDEIPCFTNRVKQHMAKALREAKQNSNWLKPNLTYEKIVEKFIEEVFVNQNFIETFLPFQKKIAFYGCFNSLSQVLLKMTSPGIPDFYQGAELWDLNLVDPDNRQPVDYKKRQQALMEIANMEPCKAPVLLENFTDGIAKLYIIYKTLSCKHKMKELFDNGAFIPLGIKGRYNNSVIAFMRKNKGLSIIVVVPRFLSCFVEPYSDWGTSDWADTKIYLPSAEPLNWVDLFTDEKHVLTADKLSVGEVLSVFPVALLIGEGHS